MDTLKAIKTRRSVRKVKEVVPPDEMIRALIDAGRRGPNHFNTEPWHYYVLKGTGRERLGKVYGELAVKKLENPDQAQKDAAMAKGVAKANRSPVVIVITIEPRDQDQPKVKRVEEVAATACAVENMLLAAHSLGLGAIWRTGDAAYTDEMKKAFGVSENGLVLGYVYVGFPEDGYKPNPRERKSVDEVSDWITE
ncbi:nitroreductase family protein [Sporolactobacillus vineae]|uniref:nitroreductase family protein n=1 Tax=Sporolactobacillus vineae TaxID=444463 RepID=UPI0002888B0C|nr:nitroreductase [Sporolactobacillus vineae]